MEVYRSVEIKRARQGGLEADPKKQIRHLESIIRLQKCQGVFMPIPKKTTKCVQQACNYLSKALRTNRLKPHQRDIIENSHRNLARWLNENSIRGVSNG